MNLLGLLEKGIELDLGEGQKLDIIELSGEDPCLGDSFHSVCMLKKLQTIREYRNDKTRENSTFQMPRKFCVKGTKFWR